MAVGWLQGCRAVGLCGCGAACRAVGLQGCRAMGLAVGLAAVPLPAPPPQTIPTSTSTRCSGAAPCCKASLEPCPTSGAISLPPEQCPHHQSRDPITRTGSPSPEHCSHQESIVPTRKAVDLPGDQCPTSRAVSSPGERHPHCIPPGEQHPYQEMGVLTRRAA